MARTRATGIRNRRTQVIATVAATLIVASLALPRLMAPGEEVEDGMPRKARLDPAEAERRIAAVAAERAAPTEPGKAAPASSGGPAGRIAVEHVARAADDLEVVLGLRWESYPAGTAIQATVEIANRDETPVWIPAPGEPQRTLSIRVLDESGATVRRVVEESTDRLPRRMRRLGPGESTKLKIDVVAHGEKPLPPGRYQLAAVYESDPAWERSGLPVWTAPKGVRHSDRVSFEVTSR